MCGVCVDVMCVYVIHSSNIVPLITFCEALFLSSSLFCSFTIASSIDEQKVSYENKATQL